MKCLDQSMETIPVEADWVQDLSFDDHAVRYQTVRNIRNSLIGMKTKKIKYVQGGLVERLLELLTQVDTSVEFGVEAATILGCLARGDSGNTRKILDSQAVPLLCKGVCNNDERLVMSCLLALRICFMTNQLSADLIFEDPHLVSTLVQLLKKSPHAAECAANILQRSCKNLRAQSLLYDADIIPALVIWLSHKQSAVLVPVLGCLTELVYKNEVIADRLFKDISDDLMRLILHHKADVVRLEAATCLTKIMRALSEPSDIRKIEEKLLAVFASMCQKEKEIDVKVKAAASLAYLIEENAELQEITSISNHLIKNVSSYFLKTSTMDKETVENMRESGFKLFAVLSSNDERIRKQIVDSTPNLVAYIHEAIHQEVKVSLQASALQCLLSLSRSVQQLRTTFQDVKLWEPVISALKSGTADDVISVASSVLCNLLLDFSPWKEALVDYGALEVLLALIKREEPSFRVNGVWGLMNLAYDADDLLKNKIVEEVGMDTILSLINDHHTDVAVKALGILRNLLTDKEKDIDKLMKVHGEQIITAITPLVLAENIEEKLKEQVLCLLSHIANGCYAKELLLAEDLILAKVIAYITDESEQLQIASVFCVTNLMRNDDSYAADWEVKLRELGTEKQLSILLTTSNTNLLERVKVALQQFN